MQYKNAFDMQTQLQGGRLGEEAFHAKYPQLRRLDGLKADFELPDGTLLELKTDSHFGSPNYFIEVFGNFAEKRPGGPFKAILDGAQFFVYRFVDGEEAWFKSQDLVDWIKENGSELQVSRAVNGGWESRGYLVPKFRLERLRVTNPLL